MYPVERFPAASRASTVKRELVPAVFGEVNPESTSVVAALDTTWIPFSLPVMEAVVVSVAVTDCAPTVLSTTPLVNV